MNALNLFIDTTDNALIAGLNAPTTVDPLSLPFLVGGYLPLNVYLLNKTGSTLQSYNPFIVIPNYGITLVLYITDGTYNGTVYTQQVNFVQDANGQFFSGTLALNTAALGALLAGTTVARPWLMVGYFDQAGTFIPCLTVQILCIPGAPSQTVSVPAGLTPMSVQQADGRYTKVDGDPGAGTIWTSPLGKKFLLRIVDLPGSGAEWQFNPIN